MGRARKNKTSNRKSSKKPTSSTINEKERLKVFANFIVDRIIEEQKRNPPKEISDKKNG